MEYKALKFEVNVVNQVTLSFDAPRITPSKKFPGKNMIWYGIKELINGENGFNASESLHAMIQASGAKKNDMIEIKKCVGDKFAYFTVNGKTLDDYNKQAASTNEVEVVNSFSENKQVTYETKVGELSLEDKVAKMWNKFIIENPDEEDVPF